MTEEHLSLQEKGDYMYTDGLHFIHENFILLFHKEVSTIYLHVARQRLTSLLISDTCKYKNDTDLFLGNLIGHYARCNVQRALKLVDHSSRRNVL